MHRWQFPGALILADSQMAYLRFGKKRSRVDSFPIRTLEELSRAESAVTKMIASVAERSDIIRTLGDAFERHLAEAFAAIESRQSFTDVTFDASIYPPPTDKPKEP